MTKLECKIIGLQYLRYLIENDITKVNTKEFNQYLDSICKVELSGLDISRILNYALVDSMCRFYLYYDMSENHVSKMSMADIIRLLYKNEPCLAKNLYQGADVLISEEMHEALQESDDLIEMSNYIVPVFITDVGLDLNIKFNTPDRVLDDIGNRLDELMKEYDELFNRMICN